MSSVSMTRRCRPIRLGFVIRPTRKDDLRRAIEINTVLWGGIYNPMIPLYKRTPIAWRERWGKGPSAREILAGYIATFQPDFLVKPGDAELPEGVFPTDRVISPSDVLSAPDPQEYAASRSPIRFGLDVMDLYREAYRKVFRFVQKRPERAEVPAAKGRYNLLGQCLWGLFPREPEFAYYQRSFVDVFDAEAKSYRTLESCLPGVITPLTLTAHGLENSGRLPDPSCFILDGRRVLDLIDFWNLRACGGVCVPVPISAIKLLKDETVRYMEGYARKLAVNSEKESYPTLVPSRSLGEDALKKVAKALSLPTDRTLCFGYYPRLWSHQEASWDRFTPVWFQCNERLEHIDLSGRHLTFDAPSPEFAARFGRHGPRWMNVISTDEYSPDRLPANVIPDGLRNVRWVLGGAGLAGIWATDDGIAICCEHKEWRHHWELPDATKIGKEWGRERGYAFEVSDSGHILQSMVEATGGLFAGRWFADAEIIRALGKMADGQVVRVGEFRKLVRKAYRDEPAFDLDEKNIRFFQDKGLLNLGITVQCPHCRQHPWYPLEGLGHTLKCRGCLREFAFPFAKPPTRGWGYRSLGPFAAPGRAQGAYSVFLALRFLDEQADAATTCIPSCNLKKGNNEIELDFVCFWRRNSWRERRQHTIVGECKSFNRFEEKDVRRMQEAARAFPGAVMAFCTLNDGLSRNERKMISRFALSGRRPLGGGGWKTPVVVLTAKELCVNMPAHFPSSDSGGDWGEFERRMPQFHWSIYDLCDASQQIYLGLKPWHQWLEEHYEKKRKRKAKSGRK